MGGGAGVGGETKLSWIGLFSPIILTLRDFTVHYFEN